MKTITILYFTQTPSPKWEYSPVTMGFKLVGFVRAEESTTNNDLYEALLAAKPREGETVLNSIHVTPGFAL